METNGTLESSGTSPPEQRGDIVLASKETAAPVWSEWKLLDTIRDQVFKNKFIPLEQYPASIELTEGGGLSLALKLLKSQMAKNISETERMPSDETTWREDGINIYARKDGTFRHGVIFTSKLAAEIEIGLVDDDFDPLTEGVGIGLHSHGAHQQIVRFFSPGDLVAPLSAKYQGDDGEYLDFPVAEGIVCPGITFFVFATGDTPALTSEGIEAKTDNKFLIDELSVTSKTLLQASNNGEINLMSSAVLPRVPSESIFPDTLSEYGVSLTIYAYVLKMIQELNLAVYSIKDGDNKLRRITEKFS